MQIFILDLLKFNKLNGIELGLKENEVLMILGEPKLKSENSKFGITYKYDNFQLHFLKNRLISIGIYFYDDTNKILFSHIKPLPINRRTTISQLTSLLDDSEISWGIDKNLTFPKQACIYCSSNIKFFFDTDISELEKIIISK